MQSPLTAQEVYSFVKLCYGDVANESRSSVFTLEYFERTIPTGGYVYLRAGNDLVALAKVSVRDTESSATDSANAAPEASIDLLCVHPMLRGKGTGLSTMILDDAIASIVRQAPDVQVIRVETASDCAKRLYARRGFALARVYDRAGWGQSSVFFLSLPDARQ